MNRIVDYSFGRPDPKLIKSTGFLGAMRYLADRGNPKVITAPERDRLQAAGLAIGFVWETTADRAKDGFAAGQFDVAEANRLADELGAPDTVAIYFAVDRPDTTPAQVRDYFRAVIAGRRRPAGVYGSHDVVEGMLDLGCRYGWQVDTWGPRVSPRAHLAQLGNVKGRIDATDENDVLQEDWGQWALTREQDDTLRFIAQVVDQLKQPFIKAGNGDFSAGLDKFESLLRQQA